MLIVHGKGNHRLESQNICPLAETVRLFIETDSRLGASGHPENKQGGKGATWVIIKQKKSLKTLIITIKYIFTNLMNMK